MDKKNLSIAIPASIISDTPHLREKTAKVGLIGRAAAIFRIEQIILYPDNKKTDQTKDLEFISLLLNYLETPQYLRKTLFKIEPDLQYAGILPPLRTPHHPLSGKTKHLKIGEYREGIVLSETKQGLQVDIGVQQPALMRQKQYSQKERLTLQVINLGDQVEVQPVNRDAIPTYWGYKVKTEKRPFSQIARDEDFELRIATARIGSNFNDVTDQIRKKWQDSKQILIAFGAPTRGLHEIVADQDQQLEQLVDFTINTIPNQGTATVRTEEALIASLAILNTHFCY